MIKDISGNRYGRLTVVEYAGKNRQGKSLWKCKCDCGNEKNITASDLSSGRVNSCGCLRKEVTAKKNFKDLTGKTFGKLLARLLVLSLVDLLGLQQEESLAL